MSGGQNNEMLSLVNTDGNFSSSRSAMRHASQMPTPLNLENNGSGNNRPSFVSPFSSIYHNLVNPSREMTLKEFQRELACKILKTDKVPEVYPCSICGKSFSTKGNLKTHMYGHYSEKPFSCEECGRGFTQKASLEAHRNIHLGNRPHECEVCGKAFTQKGNLKTHMNSHLGQRPYECEICGRGFTQKGNMQTHIKTHYGEKPFTCPICGKAFSLKGSMKTHILSHNGTKPFKCDFCDKTFSQKQSLEKHRKSHTGTTAKPYPCEICGGRGNCCQGSASDEPQESTLQCCSADGSRQRSQKYPVFLCCDKKGFAELYAREELVQNHFSKKRMLAQNNCKSMSFQEIVEGLGSDITHLSQIFSKIQQQQQQQANVDHQSIPVMFNADQKMFNADQKMFNVDQKMFNVDQKMFSADQKMFNADQKMFNVDQKMFNADQKMYNVDQTKVFFHKTD